MSAQTILRHDAARPAPRPAATHGPIAPRLVAVLIGVVALHVLDDTVLQPQPGTSARDHLAGALIPLVLLAGAAWAYRRMRAGAGGALLLALAPLAAIAGLEAIQALGDGGPTGDDLTGLAAAAVAPVLLGIGAATLWRSRRRDDARPWRYVRRALLGVAGVIVAFELIAPVMLGYGTTHIARGVTPDADLGRPYEHVALRTSDGLRLRGWYVPSRNGAAIVAYPGLHGPAPYARMLAAHGYGVLLFDRRGEGRSEGDPNAFGWAFDRDIAAAVGFLQHRRDVDPARIGGLGLSVGAEAMLQVAAEHRFLHAVVSEGAGQRAVGEELEGLSLDQRILATPLLVAKSAAVAVFGNDTPPPNLGHLMPRITAPVFLIYAKHGEVDPVNPGYFRSLRAPKRQWEVPRGGHVAALRTMPREYERRVTAFLDETLLGRGPSGGAPRR